MSAAATTAGSSPSSATSFLLQRVQPAITGLIDGWLSTLAPIFAFALATHRLQYAFFAGLATAIGAATEICRPVAPPLVDHRSDHLAACQHPFLGSEPRYQSGGVRVQPLDLCRSLRRRALGSFSLLG